MKSVAVIWLVAWALFSMPWSTATTTPQWERVRAPRVRSWSRVRPDHVLNVLFYVPLVPIAYSIGWSIPVGVAAGAGFSLAAEGIQLFSYDRAPDGNDVIANVGGTLAGAALITAVRRRRRATTRTAGAE